MSERLAEVIEIKKHPHPEADTLSLVFHEGFVLVVKTECWEDGQLAVFVRADELVDTSRPEFEWLKEEGKEKHRVKTRRFVGIYSNGLLVPAPEGSIVGQNLYEELGLEHYDYEIHEKGANLGFSKTVKTPPFFSCLSKYDVENGKGKFRNMFVDGEDVFVMSKLNGSNMSVTFTDGKIQVHSRIQWPEQTEDNLFWRAALAQLGLIKFCEEHEDWIVFGEMIGSIPKFKYDCKPGEVKMKCFDIRRKDMSWLNSTDLVATCHFNGIDMAPTIGSNSGWMPYNFDKLCQLSEGPCPLGGKIQEGLVVRPRTERYDMRYGRVISKFINPVYLSK